MKTLFATALAASSLVLAGAALAQPTADSGGVDPAPSHEGPYAGAGSPQRFYDVGQRIEHLQARIESGALPRPEARKAQAQLGSIRAELKFRMDRKHGELLDWDRELITQKLDAFTSRYPALAGAPG